MCAIFGLIDYKNHFSTRQREKVLKVLSHECEVRGKDATGFAYVYRGEMSIYKRPEPASRLHLRLPLGTNVILGHTRMATQGDKSQNFNNHPFFGKCGEMPFALAHNGVLYNDKRLRSELNLPKTNIETDSYIAVQLLEQHETLDLNSIAKMAEQVEGSFVFTILDSAKNLYFVKGDNPLALYHFRQQGFYIYASTDAILCTALGKLGLLCAPFEEVLVDLGDIVKIDEFGQIERGEFDISHYTDWDYRYLFNYHPRWWNEPSDEKHEADSAEIRQLKLFASQIGVAAEHIDLLLEYGYSEDEIEEMIYVPNALQCAIDEILCEYAYCGDW